MKTTGIAQSRTGAAFGVESYPEHVPTGPHSDGPLGVHILSNAGHGWRSAHREWAARERGTTYGRVKLVATMEQVNLSGVRIRHTWWL